MLSREEDKGSCDDKVYVKSQVRLQAGFWWKWCLNRYQMSGTDTCIVASGLRRWIPECDMPFRPSRLPGSIEFQSGFYCLWTCHALHFILTDHFVVVGV
jgi:hypothetical protein